jgi:hypothetical protein
MGLGPRIGIVDPDNVESVVGFGAVADLGLFSPKWGFDASFDYWSKSYGNDQLGETKISDLVFAARARYALYEGVRSTRPYVYVGPAIHFLKASVDVSGFGSASDTDSEIGLDFGFGIDITASPKTDVFFDAGYRAVDNFGQLMLMGGVMFAMGR